VHKVSPHGKVPIPNDEDYIFDPNTYDGEFYQPEGLEGRFDIDMSSLMGMEVDNDIDEDDGDEVQNANDLQMLERLHLGDDNDDNVGDEADFLTILIVMPMTTGEMMTTREMMITREMMTREIISNSCNTILLLLLICNYVLFIFHLFIRTYKFILHLCNCRNSTKCLGEGRGVSTRSTRHPPLRRMRSRRRRRRRGGLGPAAPVAVRG